MSWTICSFHHPAQEREASISTPLPVAARMRESCHHPPARKMSGRWKAPIVGLDQRAGLGRGELKTVSPD